MKYMVIALSTILSGTWSYWVTSRKYKKSLLYVSIISIIIFAGSLLFGLYDYDLLKTIRYLILINGIVFIGFVDFKERIIPNEFLLYLLYLRILLIFAEVIVYRNAGYVKEIVLSPILGLLVGGGIFFVCYLISRNGVGAGDVKLFAIVGLYVGTGVLFPIMILSAMFCAIFGIVMVILRKMKIKDELPFGPFAAVGTILALLLGF